MSKRNPHRIIYGSSYDRGLWYACDIYDKVKEQVDFDDLEFVVFYGWNTYDAVHKDNPERMKWKWELIRKLNKSGIKECGRISHEQLAEEYKKSAIWLYPTGFEEIDCITAKKAQAAGCTPITTGYGALQVSVMDEEKDWGNKIYSEDNADVIDDLVARTVEKLNNPETEKEREARAQKVLNKFGWEAVAKQWSENLK